MYIPNDDTKNYPSVLCSVQLVVKTQLNEPTIKNVTKVPDVATVSPSLP